MSIGEQVSDKDSNDVTQGTQASELKTNMRERAAKSETTESGSEGGEY